MGDREATVAERVPARVPAGRGPCMAGIRGPHDGQFNRSAKIRILLSGVLLRILDYPLITVLVYFFLAVKLRDRVLVLIGRAYKSIRVSDLCALLGQPEDKICKGESTVM